MERSEHAFYQEFAEVTKGFLDYECRSLPIYAADTGNGSGRPC